MVGRIARYRGDNQWQDMADAGGAGKPASVRDRVSATLASGSATLPSSTHPSPAQMTFGVIAGRGPSPDRSGKVEKQRKAAAVSFRDKLKKTGDILYEMSGLDHILSGDYLTDASEFMQLAEPGMGTGVDGRRTPEENDRVTDIAGAYGMDALNVAIGSSPFSRPSNSVGMFLPQRGAKGEPRMHVFELAQKMEREGASPEEIWRVTAEGGNPGLWRAPDGRWRWELSDDEMRLTEKGKRLARSEANMRGDIPPEPLGTLIDHPAFYDAVPNSRGAMARIIEDGVGSGSYDPRTKNIMAFGPRVVEKEWADAEIAAGRKPPKSLLRVAGHEMQHLGSNVNDMPTGSMPGDADHTYIQAADMSRGRLNQTDYKRYLRSSDEVLARLTDQRLHMTPEERALSFPGNQMDIPAADQWMREVDGSIWTPDGKGGREGWAGPRNDWMNYKSASAEEAATPVPANGPRRRRSPIGFGPTSDELLQQAISTPRKMNKNGDFMGAPPGISTPEQEQALIDDLLARLRANPNEDNFYDSSQEAIRQWTDDPVMARRFVSSSGHTSNMMSPLPNTNYAIKGMNQYAVGDDINTGMFHTAQSPKVRESFEADRLSADPKTGQYSYHLLPEEHRPADFGDYAWGGDRAVTPGRAVHDTWDKVAFRYPEKPVKAPDGSTKMSMPAASDPEHLFMDRVYNKLLRQARRDPALRRRLGPIAKGYERAQSSLWGTERAAAEMFDVLPFDQIMDRTSGFTQMAAIPGPTTGVDQALLNAPLNEKRLYTDDMFGAFSTPDGANIPARALGMSPPMREGFGPWRGMMEPNRTIDFAVASDGLGKNKTINPSSDTAQRTVRNWNQFFLGQEGSGFTMPSEAGATRATSNLASISGVKATTPDEFNRAMAAVEEVFGPGWTTSIGVQQGRNGELVLKNFSGQNNAEFQKAVSKVHAKLGGIGQTPLRDIGNDFTEVQFNDPSYRTLMDETRNNPVLKKTFDEKVLPHIGKLQAESEKWAAQMGVPANTVPDRVRRIFMQAGENWPQAMDEAVKKGLIPSIALPFVYGAMQGQFAGEEGVQ